jgi:hypothetical protein
VKNILLTVVYTKKLSAEYKKEWGGERKEYK